MHTVNGLRLDVECSGDGEPVVLVHGSWSDLRAWDALAFPDTLRVIRYSRRGHSASECPPGQGTIADDVADLAALVQTVGPAHLVGNSLGAEIALRLAVDRPELVRSLALHEPGFWSLAPDDPAVIAMRARLAPAVERLAAGGREAGTRAFADALFGPGAWDGAMPDALKRVMLANAMTFVDEERAPDYGALDTARLPVVPTLLTLGEETDAAFVVVTERLAALLPHAERVTIAGAGHIPHRTHPDVYAELVTRFVTTARARR
ncbi:MAG TPA: alpha/beta hydrolase [Solirubrobacteraceae bacterium]|jgi:pimeloyl-ACP methyl ester carboxylesterase|nr:alpha/beta hydrolase [Solirubrobacteraceae bacterium]